MKENWERKWKQQFISNDFNIPASIDSFRVQGKPTQHMKFIRKLLKSAIDEAFDEGICYWQKHIADNEDLLGQVTYKDSEKERLKKLYKKFNITKL